MNRRPLPPLVFLVVTGSVAVSAQGPAGSCGAPDARVAVDHVVLAVQDLDRASTRFRDLGFVLKEGRLHANGLLNRHVKLRSDEDLELMSLQGSPGDSLAREYARFLEDGEGGAFLALRASADTVLAAASRLGVVARRTEAGPFTWVTFPGDPGLGAVFFIETAHPPEDADSVLAHPNAADDLEEVGIEAGAALVSLLAELGAVRCGGGPGGGPVLMAVRGARIAVVPAEPGRPRVLDVVLRAPTAERTVQQDLHGIGLRIDAGDAGPRPTLPAR